MTNTTYSFFLRPFYAVGLERDQTVSIPSYFANPYLPKKEESTGQNPVYRGGPFAVLKGVSDGALVTEKEVFERAWRSIPENDVQAKLNLIWDYVDAASEAGKKARASLPPMGSAALRELKKANPDPNPEAKVVPKADAKADADADVKAAIEKIKKDILRLRAKGRNVEPEEMDAVAEAMKHIPEKAFMKSYRTAGPSFAEKNPPVVRYYNDKEAEAEYAEIAPLEMSLLQARQSSVNRALVTSAVQALIAVRLAKPLKLHVTQKVGLSAAVSLLSLIPNFRLYMASKGYGLFTNLSHETDLATDGYDAFLRYKQLTRNGLTEEQWKAQIEGNKRLAYERFIGPRDR
jgi:hypothetical protein